MTQLMTLVSRPSPNLDSYDVTVTLPSNFLALSSACAPRYRVRRFPLLTRPSPVLSRVGKLAARRAGRKRRSSFAFGRLFWLKGLANASTCPSHSPNTSPGLERFVRRVGKKDDRKEGRQHLVEPVTDLKNNLQLTC